MMMSLSSGSGRSNFILVFLHFGQGISICILVNSLNTNSPLDRWLRRGKVFGKAQESEAVDEPPVTFDGFLALACAFPRLSWFFIPAA
ncbi:hypothetical protein [Rhizobium sp. Root1203]|uniref:hypothetical protein n=1 Tax=Rhizobium sp. Root1203 TaxID=1736427 RepID=UPI00138F0DC4|nr:hypothetical protein [Rhizobium sp. Root1203]